MGRIVGLLLMMLSATLGAQGQTTIYWKKDHIRDASGNTIAVATPAPSDATAPTTPSSLGATSTTTTSVTLSWGTSTDSGGAGLAGYVIYRGAVPVGAVGSSSSGFTDLGLIPNTTYAYRVASFDHAYNYSSFSSTTNVTTDAASGAPLNLTATSVSTSQVDLNWTAPDSGAPHHYGVWRRANGSYSKIDTTNSTSYADVSVSANTAYLYKISAEDGSNVALGESNVDLATTIIFTDATITVGSTVIKQAHVTELRTAVEAVRAAAGLSAPGWTHSSIDGAWIQAVDVTELRTHLGDAITALGLTAPNYTDTILGGTVIKKAHIEQLRQRVK